MTPKITLTPIAQFAEEGYGPRLAFSPDGRNWVAGKSGLLHFWRDLALQDTVWLRGRTTGQVAYSGDGALLYAAPYLFDITAHTVLELPPVQEQLPAGLPAEARAHPDLFEVANAAWSPDGEQVAVFTNYRPLRGLDRKPDGYAGPRGRLLLLEGRTRALQYVLWQGDDAPFEAITLSATHLVSGGEPIAVWDRASGELVVELDAHHAGARDLAFSPDGALLAGAAWGGQVAVWETAGWGLIAAWPAHEGHSAAVAFHPSAPVLATGGGDRTLKLWEWTPEPALLASVPTPGYVEGIAFRPDGRRLIAAAREYDSTLLVYDVV